MPLLPRDCMWRSLLPLRSECSPRALSSIGLPRENAAAYGINTGFGKLADVRVPPDQVAALQQNLVRSHCCGVGEPLSEAEVRGMLLLRANVLAKGCSGVRTEVAELLVAMLEQRIHPVVPSRGSVGASGDLAPLAHLALALIGEGEVFVEGKRAPAAAALAAAGLSPLRLKAKEGLALLNGTQAMASVGGLSLFRAQRVVRLFDLAGAMSLEGLRGTPAAFDARIHEARPHPGQIAAAAHLRALMEQSEIRESHRLNDPRVQDAYCLRCMPQVHGAVRGVLDHATAVIETETGAATDNPLIFATDGRYRGYSLRRQLPWRAAGLCAGLCGDRAGRSAQHQRAAHRPADQSGHQRGPAAVSVGQPGDFVGLHDRPRHRCCAAERGKGAGASRERGLGADVGWQGGPRFDGDDRCAEAAAGRRECRDGAGDRIDDSGAGTGISFAFARCAAGGGGAGAGARVCCAACAKTACWRATLRRWLRRFVPGLSTSGWGDLTLTRLAAIA